MGGIGGLGRERLRHIHRLPDLDAFDHIGQGFRNKNAAQQHQGRERGKARQRRTARSFGG